MPSLSQVSGVFNTHSYLSVGYFLEAKYVKFWCLRNTVILRRRAESATFHLRSFLRDKSCRFFQTFSECLLPSTVSKHAITNIGHRARLRENEHLSRYRA